MQYTIIYDLTAQPPLNWRSLVLPFGLALAALICAYYTRPGRGRSGLVVFAVLAVLIFVGIPSFDYYQLSQRKPEVIEGVITNHWDKVWTTRHDGKNQHYSYEGFQVDTVSFGYFRNVEMAGFTNTEPSQFSIQNGLPVRIHYVPERQLDDGNTINRILKFEVVQ